MERLKEGGCRVWKRNAQIVEPQVGFRRSHGEDLYTSGEALTVLWLRLSKWPQRTMRVSTYSASATDASFIMWSDNRHRRMTNFMWEAAALVSGVP